MSRVTNCIFSFCVNEKEIEMMKEINIYLKKRFDQMFISADDINLTSGWYGGSRFLETPLWVAAFNYFCEDEFMEFIKTLPWREPEFVQLIMQDQEEDKFTVLEILKENKDEKRKY